MIPLLPYKQLVFESPLNQEEVIQRLTLEVAKPRSGLQRLKIRTENFEERYPKRASKSGGLSVIAMPSGRSFTGVSLLLDRACGLR
jgi:hypothetical protein